MTTLFGMKPRHEMGADLRTAPWNGAARNVRATTLIN